jgi:hypothetical protein
LVVAALPAVLLIPTLLRLDDRRSHSLCDAVLQVFPEVGLNRILPGDALLVEDRSISTHIE